jgi:hypothetical protein
VKTIFYPLPYCPSDAIVERLERFVKEGGQLYVSGDISYDSLRQRTRTDRLRRLCGVGFIAERYAPIDYGKGAIGTVAQGLWPAYDAAPSMEMKLEGARALLMDVSGHPVVTEHGYGKGRVMFSADPIELHGDPRYQSYGHAFYRALVNALKVPAEKVEGQGVHCFRVPSQDARQVKVLVNHGAKREAVTVDGVRLVLETHLPGVVVSEAGKGLQAVESSGDVFENGSALISSDLHMMAIAFDREPLASAKRVLLLPMGTGTMTLHTKHALVKPVLLMGEIVDGRWKQYAVRPLQGEIAVDAELSLSMLLVCEEADRAGTIAEMEVWMNTPWKLGEA